LDGLASLRDAVLDGEVVVVTPSGRADFDLLGARIHGRRQGSDAHPVTLFTFDVLEVDDADVRERPWTTRRQILDDLDLTGCTSGAARATIWTEDGSAMHEATRNLQAEGTVSKRPDSPTRRADPGAGPRPSTGQSRPFSWLDGAPQLRPRPGGLIVAEEGQPIGVASLTLPDSQRAALLELMHRYGRQHHTGAVTIPENCLEADMRFTSRTPTHGHLREAFVDAVRASSLAGV
jgi:hypothetical protein